MRTVAQHGRKDLQFADHWLVMLTQKLWKLEYVYCFKKCLYKTEVIYLRKNYCGLIKKKNLQLFLSTDSHCILFSSYHKIGLQI